MHHPWRQLRHLAEWTLLWGALPDGVLGLTCWRSRTITLIPGLSQAQRRSVLAHELQHATSGPAHPDPVLVARDELWADKESARKLISIRDLGEAMAWSTDLHEIADELWVDTATVRCRLQHLHPAERAYLRRRLECGEH